MPRCAVIDSVTGVQINTIVAEATDLPPDGCCLVELPEGCYWNGVQISPIPVAVNDGD